jgi:hypothetical protein
MACPLRQKRMPQGEGETYHFALMELGVYALS